MYGAKDVRAIASYVGSRNATQVRTHAQKYFLLKERERRSALLAARKRSMSESDIVRMGARAVAATATTPPGSPLKRETLRRLDRRAASSSQQTAGTSQDTRMADVGATPVTSMLPLRVPSGLSSPLSTCVISNPSMLSQAAQPPAPQLPPVRVISPAPDRRSLDGASADKPPLEKRADSSGINRLSLVSSEHHTVRSNI